MATVSLILVWCSAGVLRLYIVFLFVGAGEPTPERKTSPVPTVALSDLADPGARLVHRAHLPPIG